MSWLNLACQQEKPCQEMQAGLRSSHRFFVLLVARAVMAVVAVAVSVVIVFVDVVVVVAAEVTLVEAMGQQ